MFEMSELCCVFLAGKAIQAARVLREGTILFPMDVQMKKELGVALLIAGRNTQAKPIFQEVTQNFSHLQTSAYTLLITVLACGRHFLTILSSLTETHLPTPHSL